MKKINLVGKYKNSEIIIEKGILKNAGKLCLENCDVDSICIMTDSNISPIYLEILENSFPVEKDIISLNIPAGEEYKHLFTVEEIYKVLADSQFGRDSMIIALGGGVVGDIAGFVAATYLRGVKHFVQIPTTLLAQVDSSIGGKCGVDLPQGKNLVGSFRLADKVLIDVKLLKTLEKRAFMSGMAEVIKYGVVKDKMILEAVELIDYYENLQNDKGYKDLEDLVGICIKIKKDIVEMDEFDNGVRKILNFGHTIGHALEKIGEYHQLTHGEAVSIGMVGALEIGEKLFKTKEGTKEYIKNLLEKHGLPTKIPYLAEDIYSAILNDKKRDKHGIEIISVEELGKTKVKKISFEELSDWINHVINLS